MPKNKTDNFLKAIKKYASAQKKAMRGEVKQLKSERVNEAEQKGIRDSQNLIRAKLHETRNANTALLASKTLEGQKKLYIERAKMTDDIFRLASDKLRDYAQTEEYRQKLMDSAKAVAELFNGSDCVVYINERDMVNSGEIKSFFGENTEIRADKTIKIGGVRGYCESMGIIADETLDSKLEAQREWFVENATLSVL